MKQFIRYLYEYESGKRVRNVGFIKVEKQAEQCIIQIQGKGLVFGPKKELEVYVCYTKDEQCIGILQGSIGSGAPVIRYTLRFAVEDVGDAETFAGIDGIILKNDGKTYAAIWSESPADVEEMQTKEEIRDKAQEIQEKQEIQETSVCEEAEEASEISTCEEEVETYIPPRTRMYEKIQRRDISRFPRREWKLANNSFLLHGFYNYHHLLYIEEGENCWLGVPGIYHEKERTAARAFGFPQFHRITDTDLELTNEEKNTYDDFGYWCRQVSRQ